MFRIQTKEELLEIPKIASERSKVLLFCSLQLFSAIAGLVISFTARKSRLLTIVNSLNSLLAILGLIGAYDLKKKFLGVHGVATFCGLGGFFLFQVFEAILTSRNMNDQFILFMYSIPYLVDFISGFFSVSLLVTLLEADGKYSGVELQQGKQCVVCIDRKRKVLIYPCGHKCLCRECAKGLVANRSYCPICRGLIQDMVNIYSS